jgi:hypothetical protein
VGDDVSAARFAARLGGVMLALVLAFVMAELAHRAGGAYRHRDLAAAAAPQANDPKVATLLTINYDRRRAPEGLAQGWSAPEPGSGVWSDGRLAVLQLPAVAQDRDVDLALTLVPFVYPPRTPAQTVTVRAGGRTLAHWRLTTADQIALHVALPRAARKDDGSIALEFDLPDAAAPADLIAGSTETRKIAIKLIRISLAG